VPPTAVNLTDSFCAPRLRPDRASMVISVGVLEEADS
jgi:hypothetical protein